MRHMRLPMFLSRRGTPEGMLPQLTRRRFKCTAVVLRQQRGTSNACPPLLSSQQRGDGHSRSYTRTCITARQANRMPLHILLVTTGLPGYCQSPHKLPQKRHPGLSAPKGCLILRIHFRSIRKVCAVAHLVYRSPFEPFAPQGAGSLLLLGARLARGRAPAEEGTGLCPVDPL